MGTRGRGPGTAARRPATSRPSGATARPGGRNVRPGTATDRERTLTPPRRGRTPQVWRLAGVVFVLVMLSVFLFPTVSGYLQQRAEITRLEQQILSQREDITSLEGKVAAWDDPAYVEQQARERLRFVQPGETAFTVLDDTGELLTEPLPGMAPVSTEVHESRPWYGEVWESVKIANAGLPETGTEPGSETGVGVDD